jgi:hypothetical protein
MGFLKAKFRDQWAFGEAILARIETHGLEPTLDVLVGAEFLEVLRARQAAYGEALGITKKLEVETDETAMVELLRAARAEIGKYARVVASAVDNEEIDVRGWASRPSRTRCWNEPLRWFWSRRCSMAFAELWGSSRRTVDRGGYRSALETIQKNGALHHPARRSTMAFTT